MIKKKKKITLADPSKELINSILNNPKAKNYEFSVAMTGPTALSEIHSFDPDLLLIDLVMPQIHAIEVIKTIKTKQNFASMGIIVTSYHIMIQNYRAAIEEGANYFLTKPFSLTELFELIERYFEGNLKPAPFSLKSGQQIIHNHCYHPTPSIFSSYIRFWGTRGSNPVSGPQFVRYGGNTSCLEIRNGKDLVIIDAGTGIRELGDVVHIEDNQTIHLFLSHTHWDHITGFPFFGPLYKKNCSIVIWAPIGFQKTTKELFEDMLETAYFPVRLDEMKSKITFRQLMDNRILSVGNLQIDCHFTNHPGATLGFKIKTPNKTIAYLSDNEVLLGYNGHPNNINENHPLLEPHKGLIKFLGDCDLIIHEAQYFPEEYHNKAGWGHSSISNATVLVKYTKCKEWLVSHHDPNHTDEDLQIKLQLHKDIIKECNLNINVDFAYDGLMIPI